MVDENNGQVQARSHRSRSGDLDLAKRERAQKKTVEVGRGFTAGASQADVGILVLSARKGAYETVFENGAQTREIAILAKTQGVNKIKSRGQ